MKMEVEEESILIPDPKTVAFEQGYRVYDMLWNTFDSFLQLPSPSDLMMRHVLSEPTPADQWCDTLTFIDRGGEKVEIELLWYYDYAQQGQVDFLLLATGDRFSKGLADIRCRTFFRHMDYTVIETPEQRTQFLEKHVVTMKGDKYHACNYHP